MAKMIVTTEVSKETYEMGMALAKMVEAIKDALADGWQPGQDLPVLITAVIGNIAQIAQGVAAAPAEQKEDQDAFLGAIALALKEVAAALR